MRRKGWAMVLGIAAVILMFGFGTAAAQTVLKFSHTDQQQGARQGAAEVFGKKVEQYTNGRYKVQVYCCSQLGNDPKNIEQLVLGGIDFTVSSTGSYAPHVASLNLTMLPFIVSGKQVILILGGLFLIGKSTYEIHDKLEGEEGATTAGRRAGAALATVVVQIMLVDMVFSLDSVITAVGMTSHVPIMIVAVLVAAAIMLVFSGPVSDFVHKHPTIKVLALAFLILIGVMLMAEGFGQHVNKGYIYFAMALSLGVELLNMRLRGRTSPIELRHSQLPG